MAYAIVALVVMIIFNIVIFCVWKQIKIAIAVIDATGDFFNCTKRINFASLTYFFMIMCWSCFYYAGAV